MTPACRKVAGVRLRNPGRNPLLSGEEPGRHHPEESLVPAHIPVELQPESNEITRLGEDRTVRHIATVRGGQNGEAERRRRAGCHGRVRPDPLSSAGLRDPRVAVGPGRVDGDALIDCRVAIDGRIEPHVSDRVRIRRVEEEDELTAVAGSKFRRLADADQFVHLADGAEILRGGRGGKEDRQEEERKGQGRGPHIERRSWSPLIYISRSKSRKRVKPANRFVRRMPVLAVPKERAQELLRALMASGLVDETLKITKRNREILIPILGETPMELAQYGARSEVDSRLPKRPPTHDPRKRLDERLRSAGIPHSVAPRHWKRLGDVVVLRIRPEARLYAATIAEIYGSVLRARTVVEDRSGIHGPMRIPDVSVLWGDGTRTIHVEGGVRYALDVARVMLSPGNIEERIGLANRIRPGAVVADLFARIGYFTLPIAIRSSPV